ncbi:hypothetical protein [Streptomyces sp. IMTB 1903]|nr:hypothetical protein [Streptomyces sp. IMTB 1903]
MTVHEPSFTVGAGVEVPVPEAGEVWTVGAVIARAVASSRSGPM